MRGQRRRLEVAFPRHLADNNGQMPQAASVTPAGSTQAIGAVRKGLPTGKLIQMAQLLSVDRAVLLRILGVSERTIQRKHVLSERLSPAASDRLSRVDRIYTLTVEVFGDGEKAAQLAEAAQSGARQRSAPQVAGHRRPHTTCRAGIAPDSRICLLMPSLWRLYRTRHRPGLD